MQVFYAAILKSDRRVETELEKAGGRIFLSREEAEAVDFSEGREVKEFVALSKAEYDRWSSIIEGVRLG